MKSWRHLEPRLQLGLTLMWLAFGLSACAGPTPMISGALNCGGLVPEQLRAPVSGAPLPSGATAGEWVAFGDAQTGRLDKANEFKSAALEVIDRCEAEQARVRRPRYLGRIW